MIKHWANDHPGDDSCPIFRFKVVKCHVDALSRLLHEAIRIDYNGHLNSKSKWRYNRKTRLEVADVPWIAKMNSKKDDYDLIFNLSCILTKPVKIGDGSEENV